MNSQVGSKTLRAASLAALTALLGACGGGADAPAPDAPTAVPNEHTAAESDAAQAGDMKAAMGLSPSRSVTPQVMAADGSDQLTGFDAGESIVPASKPQFDNITGWASKPALVDASTGISVGRDPRLLSIQYEGGDTSQRYSSISADPVLGGNKVLILAAKKANVTDSSGQPIKARVQVNAYDAETIRSKEVGFKVRLFVFPDLDKLKTLPGSFDWLTISEWWNNASWTNQPYSFRVSTNIVKPSATVGTPLYFGVKAQTYNTRSGQWETTVWSRVNKQVRVPTNKWVTLEYFFREGNATAGRFYMTLTPDGEAKQVLFNVTGWTHHPSDPAPDGITEFNPMKLYTSSTVMNHIAASNGTLKFAWDNPTFRLCRSLTVTGQSPCAPAGVN